MSDKYTKEVERFVSKVDGKCFAITVDDFESGKIQPLNTFDIHYGDTNHFYLIVHKGEIEKIPASLYAILVGRSKIAFANDVYVVFSVADINKESDATKSFYKNISEKSDGFENAVLDSKFTSNNKDKNRFCQYIGNDTLFTETYFGNKIFVDSTDVSLTPHIAYEGRWEPHVTDFFCRTIEKSDVFVDIGANCGFFSLLAAHLVGETGFVLAIEPHAKLVNLIEKSIFVNGYNHRAHVIQSALSSTTGTAELSLYKNLQGSSSLMPPCAITDSTLTVPVATLPTLIEQTEKLFQKQIKPTVMKIDVEGYECHVWKGMRDYLAELNTLTILMEFTPIHYMQLEQDPYEFIQDMKQLGFDLSILEHNSEEKQLTFDDVEDLIKRRSYFDLILRKKQL